MRRADRQLNDADALTVLKTAQYGVLSTVCSDGLPYGVPLNYAYQDGCIYIHCTSDGGLKIDNLRRDPRACFTAVSDTQLLPEQFSTKYRSVICFGQVEILETGAEKRPGIEAILQKYSPDFMDEGRGFIERAMDKIHILKFHIEQMTGKARK